MTFAPVEISLADSSGHVGEFPAAQTPWGCRWSRLSDPNAPAAEEPKTPGLWLCIRPTPEGNSRSIRGVDCAACPHWATA
jgi:hypothetical protein